MVYFVSDVHLGFFPREKDRTREDLLIKFLREIRRDCSKLFIVGDLFDYWFEYRAVIPRFYTRTLAELLKFKEEGIEVEYIMGNHDFGHTDFFEKEIGIPVVDEDITRIINCRKFYISHGDGKSNMDAGYLLLKKILRNPISKKLFRLIHPDFGIWLARSSSRKSRTYTDAKNYGKTEGMNEFAEKKINEGYDYVVMGHRHRANVFTYGKGKYINLGDWMRNPTFGLFDGSEMYLLEVEKFLQDRQKENINPPEDKQ